MRSFANEFRAAYRRIAANGHPVRYKANWLTVGGAPALVDTSTGSILAACEGLEDEDLDEIGEGEAEASRERRRLKQEAAEAAGWESQETKDARAAWQDARQEIDDPSTLVLLRLGDTYYSFEDDAQTLKDTLGVGDGEVADFKEGALQGYINELVDLGHRMAIAERTESGDARHTRTEEPEDDAGEFPWESEDEPEPGPEPAGSGNGQPDEGEDSPAAPGQPAQRQREFTADAPGTVDYKGHRFEVFPRGNLWFFRRPGSSAGWTAASPETAAFIREAFEQQPAKPQRQRDRFTEAVIDAIGEDDPESVKGFKSLALDIWDRKRREAEDNNFALRSLLGQFGVEGAKQGAFVRLIQRAADYDKIKRFDEMVEMARREYPELLQWETGSFAATEDAEQALFNRLKTGLVKPPAKWSDEVIGEALEYVEAAERSTSRLDPSEWEAVPFAKRSAKWWRLVRYTLKSLESSDQQRG